MAAPINFPRPRPAFPERPKLFDEVKWGPLPTDYEIERAFKVWRTQDELLRNMTPISTDPDLVPEDEDVDTCLARSVYESLIQHNILPLSRDQQTMNAQYPVVEKPKDDIRQPNIIRTQGWGYREIFGLRDPIPETSTDEVPLRVTIGGQDIASSRWKKGELQYQLQQRRLQTNGTISELKKRLYEYELRMINSRCRNVEMGSRLPLQELPEWGLFRENEYLIKVTSDAKFSPVEMYTWAISLSPYNPTYWTSRAYVYYQMGFFDLALGDAYRAQLLCEILVDPRQRNLQPGLYIRTWDAIERHIMNIKVDGQRISDHVTKLRSANGVNYFIPHLRKTLYHLVCLSLLGLQCWEDYRLVENDLPQKLIMRDRDKWLIEKRQKLLRNFLEGVSKEKQDDGREFFYESHYGYVRGLQYPFSQPLERTSETMLSRINKEIIGKSQSIRLFPQKIEVREKDTDQIGVYATRYISAGEVVYVDEPSIRGHLHSFFPRKERLCENCRKPVNHALHDETIKEYVSKNVEGLRAKGLGCECCLLVSEPLTWCVPRDDVPLKTTGHQQPRIESQKRPAEGDEVDDSCKEPLAKKQMAQIPSCLEIALNHYHYKACGRDWKWLHDSMRPVLSDEWVQSIRHSNERHGTALSLLLREVFDITLRRREVEGKPHLMAHEIEELMPLIGADKGFEKQMFPFSYAANIRVPFDILQYLGVDIFQDLAFDTWVIQLVLRKLLLNAIPWDGDRRQKDFVDTPETKQLRRTGLPQLSLAEYPKAVPSLKNLYIFPGVSMFNGTCPNTNNVIWDWDLSVPNRMVLWACRNVPEGQELTLPYVLTKPAEDVAHRLFGGHCQCEVCPWKRKLQSVERSGVHYGDSTSEEERCTPPPPRTRGTAEAEHQHTATVKDIAKNSQSLGGAEETSSEPFATQQAMIPRSEDEGKYDEKDFESVPVEPREHSGVSFTSAQVRWHARKLRTALKEEAARLSQGRLGTTDSGTTGTGQGTNHR
ncbi:hypothetical protein LOZ66_005029 [Ophidiomyces ophidiicola]|nr:hypothetical protein LOZ66_005029 [Ophidiomyces ophidiicola]